MTIAEHDLTVAINLDPGSIVLRLAGEIDLSNADSISDAVDSISEAFDGAMVVIDMTDVTFMDSSGLKEIVTCRSLLLDRGLALEVRNPSGIVRRVFEVSGLAGLIS